MKKLTESRLRSIIREELEEALPGARHMGVSGGRQNLSPRNVYQQIKNKLDDRGTRTTVAGMNGFEYAGHFWHVAGGGVRVYDPSRLEREGETADTKLQILVDDRLQVRIMQGRRDVEQFDYQFASDVIDSALEYL